MKRSLYRTATAILSFCLLAVPVFAARELVPVGDLIGLELNSGTLTVAAYDDTVTAARDAGLRIGDEIISIDGSPVKTPEDVRRALNHSDGAIDLTVCRNGENHEIHLAPAVSAEGPKMGVYLRQGIMGIGTVTFYDPQTGSFGTLGHGVSDSKGKLLDMTKGYAYDGKIVSIQKGKNGSPGQLKGALENDRPLGELRCNTPQGVFGTGSEIWNMDAIPVASADEVCTGPARIRCTVTEDNPREYSVEILKIYPATRTDGRNLLIRVTDPQLLALTGGIVQGMSGSPLVQDGKLIGAVTHVLVNDPTMGYGIFIENMLEAAG